jgi:cell division protein FtsQ
MSTFLERQEVRKEFAWGRFVRRVERVSLSILIVLTGLAALYGLYVLIFLGPYFDIKDIEVRGHWKRLNAASLVDVSGVKQGENLFLMNVEDVHQRLVAHPWVREAAVRRHLPHTLKVFVEEHKPYAIFIDPDGMYYVDREGIMFKRVGAEDSKDYPLITGIAREEDPLGTAEEVKRKRLSMALDIIERFDRSALGKRYGISEIHFDPARGYSLMTEREPMEILLGSDGSMVRLERLDKVTTVIARGNRRIQYIMAHEPGRIIVKYRTHV